MEKLVGRVLIRLLAFPCLVLLPDAAWSQTATTGAIAGEVRDATGALMPGVTVEAGSPALIEKVRVALTDSQGQYKIVELRPGTYTVTFTLPGFSTVRREGLELNSGFTADVSVELRVGGVEETITVTGASPVVDIQNVRQQNVLTRDVLDALPTAKSVQSIAALTLGAITTSPLGGGEAGGSKGEPVFGFNQIHGSANGVRTLDGMKTCSAYNVATSCRYQFNQMAVQEMVVDTNVASAESESGGMNVNMVPKDGGNLFAGSFLAEGTNDSLQSSNLTDDLRARGLTAAAKVQKIYDIGFGMGGPIQKDKLWFYGAVRNWGSVEQLAGVYFNKIQDTLFYEADLDRPAIYDRYTRDSSLRLTWQLTSKQKLNLNGGVQAYCWCYSYFITNPEAAWDFHVYPSNNWMATWSYPLTNRLLIQAGGSLRQDRQFNGTPAETGNARPVIDLSNNVPYGSRFASTQNLVGDTDYGDMGNQYAYQTRVVTSYVTGSHSLKVGFQTMTGQTEMRMIAPLYNVQYIFRNRLPVQLRQGAFPHSQHGRLKLMLGAYGEDQWTIRNLTLNLGVRFDSLDAYNPAQCRPGGEFVPEFCFGEVKSVPSWKDVSPRLGAAYDLFGDGKTAVKFSFGRYVTYETTAITKATNPAAAIAISTTRTWNDTNFNYVPDCNLNNPALNGECGALDNQRFGTPIPTTRYDTDVTEGFGVRPFTWQGSAGIQHEIRPGFALSVGYFRTSYGNIQVTDNLAVTPADYDTFCVTAPSDARLPGGGGYPICGLYDVKPAKFGQVDGLVVRAKNFGDRTQVYNGVDIGANARLRAGVLLTGGISFGTTHFNSCNSPDFAGQAVTAGGVQVPGDWCDYSLPNEGQMQIKLQGTYPIPGGVQLSATYQNLPGLPQFATFSFTNAQVVPSLGRNLAACPATGVCTAVVTVNIFEPNTQFEPRYNQFDVRVSKNFRFNRFRVTPRVDAYNLFNSDTVINEVYGFGAAWLRPTEILTARLVKFGVQVDF
jgi:hypothetical protein